MGDIMKENKNIPEIRFEGFEGEWIQKEIKELFKITRGEVLAATETSQVKTGFMTYPVYSSQTKNNGLMGYYHDYLFENAITWTTDGANAGTVKYRKGKFYSTNVNGVLLSDDGYANQAIAESINIIAWKHVSYVGNPKLMNNVMSKIKIYISDSLEEQQLISDYFNTFDTFITLEQQKHDKLVTLKKAMLEKMFPKEGASVPEIRFEGFEGKWEERNIGQIAKVSTGYPFESNLFNDKWTCKLI